MGLGKYITTSEISPLKIFYSGNGRLAFIEQGETIDVLAKVPPEHPDVDSFEFDLLIRCSDGAIFVIDGYEHLQKPKDPITPYVKATYFSELGTRISVGTPCKYNPETGEVKEIARCEIKGSEIISEHIRIDEGKYSGSTAQVELSGSLSLAFFDKKHQKRCHFNNEQDLAT